MTVSTGFFWDESYICSSSASLATGQFLAVSLLGTMAPGAGSLPSVILTASATQGTLGAIGVLQNDPKVLQGAIVRHLGSTKMVATTSASIALGALVSVNALGQAMTADTTGQRVIGQCIASSTTLLAGALCEVLMFPRPTLGLV